MDTMLSLQANVPVPVSVAFLALLGVCVWKGMGFTLRKLANGVKFEVNPPANAPKPPQKPKGNGHKKSKQTRKKRK